MARDHEDRKRSGKDVGSRSPASKEASEQSRTGMQGAPGGEGEKGGTDREPPQSSGRSGRGPAPRARKHYAEGEAPSEQSDGSPSPERISASPGQQGLKQKSGTTADRQQRGEAEATVHEK